MNYPCRAPLALHFNPLHSERIDWETEINCLIETSDYQVQAFTVAFVQLDIVGI